jgi:hypothetical protein
LPGTILPAKACGGAFFMYAGDEYPLDVSAFLDRRFPVPRQKFIEAVDLVI